jgi:hypothetical protein
MSWQLVVLYMANFNETENDDYKLVADTNSKSAVAMELN